MSPKSFSLFISPCAILMLLLPSVLIWPHEGVGAVSVTHGDTLRLREEEFLNDSLIELGLK